MNRTLQNITAMKYLILDVFDEVPSYKTTVLTENEAEEYVRDYCNKNNLGYSGLNYKKYWPNTDEMRFLQIAPLDENPKLGFYWKQGEGTECEAIYK